MYQFLGAEDNMKVYLDNCCYNRPFSDQKQLGFTEGNIAEVKI